MAKRRCGICRKEGHDSRNCPQLPFGILSSGTEVQHAGKRKGWNCSCKDKKGKSGWIVHWRIYSGSLRETCAKEGCGNTATDGAHITIVEGSRIQKLIPTCGGCNSDWSQKLYGKFTVNKVVWVNANPNVLKCRRL